MMLVDTSAWIEFLRPHGDPVTKGLVAEALVAGQAAYPCVVRFELMVGARPEETDDLETALGFAKRIPVEPDHWDRAAGVGAVLLRKGHRIPLSDLLVAIVACSCELSLLARDRHFDLLRRHWLKELVLVEPGAGR